MKQVLTIFRRPLHIGLAMGLLIGVMAATSLTTRLLAHEELDCDDNAVIRCGIDHHNSVNDIEELKQKYRENQQGNVQSIYYQFGVDNESSFNGMVEGRVTGDNKIYVGNRLVAENAFTVGRQDISNERGSSTPVAGGAFFWRQPSVSFANPNGSLTALVKMENNQFKFAVILSCGNPVVAIPVAPPAPQPTPPVQPTTQPVPNLTITKDVRLRGQPQWVQQVSAHQGDRLQFRVTIRNTGQADLQQVIMRDMLPAQTTYVDQSLRVAGQANANSLNSELNLGSIARNQQKEVTFELAINTASSCSPVMLRNVAFARATGVAEKQDDATVQLVCAQVTPAVVTTTPQVLAATTQPSSKSALPNTGAGDVLIIFTTTVVAGGLAHNFITGRGVRRMVLKLKRALY